METEENKKYMLYVHIFPNNKRYYGITCSKYPSIRWQRGNGYKSCPSVYNAIQKYGWDNIEHKVLKKDLSESEAFSLESEYIKKYNVKTGNGYNISKSGTPGNAGIYKDYTNQKYHSLTFINRLDDVVCNGSYKWRLKCDCGKYITASPYNVISGSIKSCGCQNIKKQNEKLLSYIGITHGILECVDVDIDNNKVICKCRCGNKVVLTKRKWQANIMSCGCLKVNQSKKNLDLARNNINKNTINKRNIGIRTSHRQLAENNSRNFKCIEKNMIFHSGYEVNDYFGKRVYSNILKALKNEIKTAYGYHWEYAD